MTEVYKIVHSGGQAHFGQSRDEFGLPRGPFVYPLPQGDEPGDWTEPEPIEMCVSGYHYSKTFAHLIDYLGYGDTMYAAEVQGEFKYPAGDTKGVAAQMRLLRRLPWDREIAADFARHAILNHPSLNPVPYRQFRIVRHLLSRGVADIYQDDDLVVRDADDLMRELREQVDDTTTVVSLVSEFLWLTDPANNRWFEAAKNIVGHLLTVVGPELADEERGIIANRRHRGLGKLLGECLARAEFRAAAVAAMQAAGRGVRGPEQGAGDGEQAQAPSPVLSE